MTNVRIFWNQAELLSQLGIWAILDEMKPSPAMKQFLFNLPIRSTQSLSIQKTASICQAAQESHQVPVSYNPRSFQHENTAANLFSTESVYERPSSKVNCKEIGGISHNIFSSEADLECNIPSTKINSREIGGHASNIFATEADVPFPSTKINSKHIGGKTSISFGTYDSAVER